MNEACQAGTGAVGANLLRVHEQSQIDDMRAAVRGDRERAEQARQRSQENVRALLTEPETRARPRAGARAGARAAPVVPQPPARPLSRATLAV